MTVWWCRGCGMEDTRPARACPTCGSAFETTDIEWLEENHDREETVFEIDAPPLERAAIVQALMTEKIRHRWDNPIDLVVDDTDSDAIENILDDIFGEEASISDSGNEADNELDAIFAQGGSGDDNDYEVLSHLYDVVDRLQKNRDEVLIAEFLELSGVALTTSTPFGMDEESWADVQSSVRNVSATFGQSDQQVDEAELKSLRNQLHTLV